MYLLSGLQVGEWGGRPRPPLLPAAAPRLFFPMRRSWEVRTREGKRRRKGGAGIGNLFELKSVDDWNNVPKKKILKHGGLKILYRYNGKFYSDQQIY